MFPLLKQEEPNPLLLFQIWLNLPKKDKFVEPHFSMLWGDSIPKYTLVDENGKQTTVDVIAGQIENTIAPKPAPNSWAANPENEVNIWTIEMEPEASWVVPNSSSEVNRRLYFFDGDQLSIEGQDIQLEHVISLNAEVSVTVSNGKTKAKLLMLQGKPINEPVAQYGPFVMNSQQEIQEAMRDYQRTQFGGWPWPEHDHVHPRNAGRFAKHADGREEFKD